MKKYKIPMYHDEIINYLKKLRLKLKPKCVILFGSLARSDYNERSDIDLIIISENLPEHPRKRLKILTELNEELIPIEPHGYTPSEFKEMIEKRHNTALFGMEEGKPLLGKSFFKKLKRLYLKMKKETGLVKEDNVWIPKKLIT